MLGRCYYAVFLSCLFNLILKMLAAFDALTLCCCCVADLLIIVSSSHL